MLDTGCYYMYVSHMLQFQIGNRAALFKFCSQNQAGSGLLSFYLKKGWMPMRNKYNYFLGLRLFVQYIVKKLNIFLRDQRITELISMLVIVE